MDLSLLVHQLHQQGLAHQPGLWRQLHLLGLVRRLGQWRQLHLLDLVGQLGLDHLVDLAGPMAPVAPAGPATLLDLEGLVNLVGRCAWTTLGCGSQGQIMDMNHFRQLLQDCQ